MRTIWVYQNSEQAADGTAAFLLGQLRGQRGPTRYSIALSGGTTPASVYRSLAKVADSSALFKERAVLFFSDERAVPGDHPDSNYGLARRLVVEPLGIDDAFVHRMRGEAPDLPAEAARYETEMRRALGTASDEKPVLDLILLGMGEDGHTASLFPGDDEGGMGGEEIVAGYVKAVGGNRISFSLPLINRGRKVLFLVTGERKADMVKKVLCPERTAYIPPAARVAATETIWVLDTAAARLLDYRLLKVDLR